MKNKIRHWRKKLKKDLMLNRYGPAAEFIIEYKKNNRGKLPWSRSYSNCDARCNNKNEPKYKYYGGRGIKNLLTLSDVKRLYLRDGAWKMKVPSLDRRDSNENYTVNNCRFVEFSLNRLRVDIDTESKCHICGRGGA